MKLVNRKTACLFILLVSGPVAGAMAQDADTILLKNDDRKFTILSQIEDPQEVASFLAVIKAAEPALRFQLANSFVRTYPQSWLLAQAYDVAAKSAIDFEKYDEALADGRFSLRLLPENPSLLILLANIEAQRKLTAQALRDASDALEYLDQIERPPNMTQAEWNTLRPQLKASAYFARARAESAQLGAALEDLNKAAAWNPEDAEIFFLRGIVELKLQQKNAGAADLAFVFGGANPLRDKAKNILAVLAKQMTPGSSLDSFVKNLPGRVVDKSLRREPQASYGKALAGGYAGPEACRACHETEYAAWRKTGMARMLRPYQPGNVIGDFSAGTAYKEGADDVIRMGVDKRPYFEFPAAGQRFYVDFTIGSKWQQGYATKLPDGRLQVLPIEYNALERKWINYWKIIDPPGSPRAVIRDFPKFTPATNYQQNCAICHTSQLKVGAAARSTEHATFLQPGIDCEMCHGPAAWHVKQMAKGAIDHPDQAEQPGQPPFDFRKATNREAVRVCAQCHRQSAVREIGEGGEMNYSTKGDFVPATWLRQYDAFSRRAFYKDGRFRETTFIVEAFTRSACYLRGAAQCATCHSPHLDNFASNQTSLKYWNNPNEMCLSCHSQYRNRIVEHSRHAAGSEASQCVSCHMPRIMNALLFQARSHQIEIPSADLTERFGQLDSPNVCLSCHAQKSAAWAKEQLAAWVR